MICNIWCIPERSKHLLSEKINANANVKKIYIYIYTLYIVKHIMQTYIRTQNVTSTSLCKCAYQKNVIGCQGRLGKNHSCSINTIHTAVHKPEHMLGINPHSMAFPNMDWSIDVHRHVGFVHHVLLKHAFKFHVNKNIYWNRSPNTLLFYHRFTVFFLRLPCGV